MKKLRTTSWFFLLVILLAIFVSFTMAQETPPVTGGQIYRYDSAEPLSGELLARSSEVIQTELSADSQNSLSYSAASANLYPVVEEDTPQEPRDPAGSPGLPLPDDLYAPLAPVSKTSGPAVPDVFLDSNEQQIDFSGRFVGLPEQMPVSSPEAESCQQLLGNTTLTWNTGSGTFLPWVILDPIVYYSTVDYTSAPHSTVLVDADSGDPNSGQDAFAQAFAMPSNLTQVRVDYNTASLNSNSTDDTLGNLWTVDSNGNLDQPIVGWEIGPSEGVWQGRFVTFTGSTDLQALQGKDIAIILFNATNGSAPGEVVFFDDVTLTACYEDMGHIIVKKQTDPAGAAQKFTFDPSWSASNFQLSDGQSKTSPALSPGTYSVNELPVSGWTQTSATCSDGSNPNNISLQPGETVTCTFKNKKVNNSYIIVKKQTDPAGAAQKFTFDPSWSASNFQLSHSQSKTSPALAAGTYSVKELAQSGWNLASATCSDGSNPNNISLQAGETVTCTFKNVQEGDESCKQLLVNTKMDVVELGGGTGTVEPWSIIFQKVYYTNDPGLAYDGYSMVLVDGDPDDTSPTIDMFGQGFIMPNNPTEFSAEYMFATLDTNPGDKAYGELWLLDDDWVLHLDEPNKYFVANWPVAESQGAWAKQTITSNDPSFLNKMAGKKVVMLLFTITDGDGTTEDVFFDNVMFTACSKAEPFGGKLFLPVILKDYGQATGPVCNPSNENPLDQFNSNRGLVQTGAICSSKLSNVDIKDYYAFKPSKDGNHTLWLTKLPLGTQWSATMFVDSDPYPFAPGSAGGKCFTSQPGHADKKVVCNLKKGTEYFVRIDSGSTPIAGSYEMKITAP